MRAVGLGLVAGPAIGDVGRELFGPDAFAEWASTSVAPTDGILVVISLYGGNDGLNTVVPFDDPTYQSRRAGIALSADEVLPLADGFGLHPELRYLHQLFDAGQVAVIHGVGCPDPDYSHFRSMGRWMAGSFAAPQGTGWVGRWLDGLPASIADRAAVSIDMSVPLHLTGARARAVAVSPSGDGFGSDASADRLRLFDTLRSMSSAPAGRGQLHDLFSSTMRAQLDLASSLLPVFSSEVEGAELTRKLTVAARLVNADLGVRVIDVGCGGFDTHESEWRGHGPVLRDLDEGLRAFFATLSPRLRNQVTLMTVSEFGRTVAVNGSGGTDHGTAAPLFVVGAAVQGGSYGQPPSLTALNPEGQLIASTDFRAVYGSVLDGWMGGGGSEIVGGGFEQLRLFRSTPGSPLTGSPTPIVVVPPASASGFVPLMPTRVFDTRDGTGGRTTPVGPRETWSFAIRGSYTVPADAVAVALNLTSVDATMPTFVTVWPSGLGRPLASNLNPVPGRVVPNLVIVRLGSDGAIQMYNNSGSVDLVADLVGYFAPSSPNGLVPLSPARVLDTRTGTAAAVGQGERIRMHVAGEAGVPESAVAVALNIAATEPTAATFLTAWPAAETRPLASTVNVAAGETASTFTLMGLASSGELSVANNTGSTHVVVDVLGCFSPSPAAKYVALAPSRVLDTRDGTGSARARVRQAPLVLDLLGRGGVPAGSVSAVVLNVTAVQPSRNTHITVHPAGIDRPVASNLNVDAGDIRANVVLATLGTDGAISFYNNSGEVDIVADVLGYFGAP
ncbi:MAG: DUF1501 domain-containing protein [Actinobacteria bacterium]|nr:DUF1501 domain-containing protein [Actinomycetota bacterium]